MSQLAERCNFVAIQNNCGTAFVDQHGCDSSTADNKFARYAKHTGPSDAESKQSSSPPGGLSSGQTTPNQAPQPSPSQQLPVPSELHVFMTSKVGGRYLLSQWNTLIPRPQNDRDFFEQLRKCYISARGHWRYYLGFKVFSHCEFYRVGRLDRPS
jgi:hypothetical protein